MRLVLALLLLAPLAASGQGSASEVGRIVGVVTDAETGDPLPGANVRVVGTKLGTVTDIDGRFEIDQVPAGSHALEASFVGYVTQQILAVVRAGEVLALTHMLESGGVICYGPAVCAEPPLVTRGVYQARVVAGPGARMWTWDCERLPKGTQTVAAR